MSPRGPRSAPCKGLVQPLADRRRRNRAYMGSRYVEVFEARKTVGATRGAKLVSGGDAMLNTGKLYAGILPRSG